MNVARPGPIERAVTRAQKRFWIFLLLESTLLVLLVSSLIGPGGMPPCRVVNGLFIDAWAGRIVVGWAHRPIHTGWIWQVLLASDVVVSDPRARIVNLHWGFAAVFALLATSPSMIARGVAAHRAEALLRRFRSRGRLGCAGCGYDLAGLKRPVRCPECGGVPGTNVTSGDRDP